ncbi:hypothetical protein RclHR1_06780008 [Rhizophagus clarus]|uniref:Uncharacterized protein n=1 Tax=Rhizophagus clarus TaxID=94130 RepID=A0A2Z6RUA1_9GLOM|nr:hypothetical protein RclHR1_06780008 [Rhizophagus clarus]GET04923.1 hypothetical protein RCL_e23742_RclHR1_06780008 [Rhizophagus clarus]
MLVRRDRKIGKNYISTTKNKMMKIFGTRLTRCPLHINLQTIPLIKNKVTKAVTFYQYSSPSDLSDYASCSSWKLQVGYLTCYAFELGLCDDLLPGRHFSKSFPVYVAHPSSSMTCGLWI